ncbi:enoyl-CoA hydratase/isomerase family protein [Fodinibius roseus]|uniref:enoyl-CoA hydratase/isomerase family protein n=1 Tax=Fodinibius roseus TaxID=1194090 RepID=UPI00093516B6|nr:enoyl-CoA hydratase/isomerase family protein [Fodinibius roseus]
MNTLKVEYNKNICEATIDRPNTRNAINFRVMQELEELLTEIESDGNTRCLILTGSGERIFVSGGDLREFHALKSAKEAKSMARRMLSILTRIEKLPCWTIASVNGPAFGGGCEMMLAFDFRIASPDAFFGFTQANFYLPPGWGGLTRLVERVGRSTALRWLGKASIVQPREALQHKLIDRVAAPGQLRKEALAWARELSHNDRTFIQNLKEGALRLAQARWKSIAAELDAFAECWESEKHRERVRRFLEQQ